MTSVGVESRRDANIYAGRRDRFRLPRARSRGKEIEFRDKPPRTRRGKIMRRRLKAQKLSLPTGDILALEEN